MIYSRQIENTTYTQYPLLLNFPDNNVAHISRRFVKSDDLSHGQSHCRKRCEIEKYTTGTHSTKKNEKRTVKCKNDLENARKTWQITPRWISCGQEIFSIISMDLDTLNPWDYKVRNVALCESSNRAFQVFAIRMLNFGCRAIFILPDFARPIIWIISNIIIILCELMVLCNFDVLYLNRLIDAYLIRKFSKFS